MVATATTDTRDQIRFDEERILWDVEYRRDVMARLKRLELERGRDRAPINRGLERPSKPKAA